MISVNLSGNQFRALGSLWVHFGFEGHFWSILGLGVSFDPFLVLESFWTHFGQGVILDPFGFISMVYFNNAVNTVKNFLNVLTIILNFYVKNMC